MMKLSTLLKLGVLIACCSGVVWADQGRGHAKKGKEHRAAGREKDRDRDRERYFERHGHTRLHIPPGHYPPPGHCRVWYPGRPPGHQPAAVRCERLRGVPPGAWVIRHPHDDPEHVHVVVYDDHRPDSVFVVGQFKIATGVFVRVVVDR